ncbi:MAG: glycosyltransferase family 2 protein [Terracidiphilus sp.]
MHKEPNGLPSVSMVVVCLNEAKWIEQCLDSVLGNDYPADRFEILVVDGDSDDGTQEVLRQYADRCSRIRVLRNEGRFLPIGLNMGIRAAGGEIVMKVDAHSEYPSDYISECVRLLCQSGAANVGGCVDAVPGSDTFFAKAAAKVLFSGFGVGNSRFRVGAGEPVWADTAYSGCYWKKTLLEVGLYDEAVRRSEDIDMNSRLKAMGGRTLLAPALRVKYHVRATLRQFCRHALSNGFWVTFPMLTRGTRFSARHFTPLAFLTSLLAMAVFGSSSIYARFALIAVAAMYTASALTASILVWRMKPSPVIVLTTAFTYATYHLLYGFGSIMGLVAGTEHNLRHVPCSSPTPDADKPVPLAAIDSGLPYVSLVLACRNEAKWIERCLKSIAANDYNANLAELLVADGDSTDGTQDIVRQTGARYPVRLIRNPLRLNAAGMNRGIREARGDVIMKIDGHSEYPTNYISECVRHLREYGAANVGGVVVSLPGADTTFARAAAKVISCRFGVGNSPFRIGVDKPMWAKTAFSGCYLKSWLLKVGLYDERISRGSDIDLNGRISASGGRTLLVPSIRVKYFGRANFSDFCRYALGDGYWVSYAPLTRGTRLSVRHFVPVAFLVFVLTSALLAISHSPARILFATTMVIYTVSAVAASLLAWRSAGSLRLIFTTAVTFGILHAVYGFGSLLGIAGWVASVQPIRGLQPER